MVLMLDYKISIRVRYMKIFISFGIGVYLMIDIGYIIKFILIVLCIIMEWKVNNYNLVNIKYWCLNLIK